MKFSFILFLCLFTTSIFAVGPTCNVGNWSLRCKVSNTDCSLKQCYCHEEWQDKTIVDRKGSHIKKVRVYICGWERTGGINCATHRC